eukprot:3160937-Amphidinium_carterae.1
MGPAKASRPMQKMYGEALVSAGRPPCAQTSLSQLHLRQPELVVCFQARRIPNALRVLNAIYELSRLHGFAPDCVELSSTVSACATFCVSQKRAGANGAADASC